MKETIDLLNVIKELLIPISTLILVIAIVKPIRKILTNAHERAIRVKTGNNEIEVGELIKQQNAIIGEFARDIAVNDSNDNESSTTENNRILWVDDFPNNNFAITELLRNQGYFIDYALSTAEALVCLNRAKYDLVISDMGRIENGTNNPNAGIELVKLIREKNNKMRIVIFTSVENAKKKKQEVDGLKIKMTSSSSRLIAYVYSQNNDH